MFCPRCGQQAAEGVSFCSRCGLPLDAAAEIVASGGAAGAEAGAREPPAALTPRQRGTRKGLIIFVAGLLFFAVAALLMAIKEDLFVFLIPAGITVVIGVVRMLYGQLLEENAPPEKQSGQPRRSKRAGKRDRDELARAPSRGGELPPARSIPASLYTEAGAGPADAAAPASVTENTTRLLDEQGRER